MREIKFRAWDAVEGCWIAGFDALGGFSIFGETMLMGEWSGILNRFILQQRDRTPQDLIVEQYTGLKDRNGVEIYEGDILEHRHCSGYGLVKWSLSTGEWCAEETDREIGPICHGIAYENTLVIGNIHENPDLLDG